MDVRYVDDILFLDLKMTFVSLLIDSNLIQFSILPLRKCKTTSYFSDITLTVQPNGEITTAVFVKPTDQGIYTIYFSHSPDMYKYSIIKTLVTMQSP